MLSDHLSAHLALVRLQRLHDVQVIELLLALLVIAATAVLADYGRMLYLRSRMPPGPFPWPIIGNTFSLPEHKPWIYFEQLSKQYNAPLITSWIGRYVSKHNPVP